MKILFERPLTAASWRRRLSSASTSCLRVPDISEGMRQVKLNIPVGGRSQRPFESLRKPSLTGLPSRVGSKKASLNASWGALSAHLSKQIESEVLATASSMFRFIVPDRSPRAAKGVPGFEKVAKRASTESSNSGSSRMTFRRFFSSNCDGVGKTASLSSALVPSSPKGFPLRRREWILGSHATVRAKTNAEPVWMLLHRRSNVRNSGRSTKKSNAAGIPSVCSVPPVAVPFLGGRVGRRPR
mmetsp:Transcript_35033/g.75590  ORF Transcript_35033/g.75590 Transcript_35033/m.75590 type:complete len:242 (-) Transcript_35033:7-732(-)